MTGRRTIDSFRRATARRLRANATSAESIVWRHLRTLEIDGSHHGEEPSKTRDEERTRWLEAAGYRVLRFWNNDIVENPEGVLDVIHAALYGSRDAKPRTLKNNRKRADTADAVHLTPARVARRPFPPRGG